MLITHGRAARFGGAALILGSLLFFVNKINEISRQFFAHPMTDLISGRNIPVIVLGQLALILGFLAYFGLYARRVERWAKHALRLLCGGGVVLAIGHVAFMPSLGLDWFILVVIGLIALLIGLIGFGVAALRQSILGRWAWLPLATGIAGFIGFFFAGLEIAQLFLIFRTLFAFGLAGLGLVLFLEKPVTPIAVDPIPVVRGVP